MNIGSEKPLQCGLHKFIENNVNHEGLRGE